MKKTAFFSLFFLLAGAAVGQNIFFNFQGVLRDRNDQPYKSNSQETLEIVVSIRDGEDKDASQELFREVFEDVPTNSLGIFNLQIGKGIDQVGALKDLNWSSGGSFWLHPTIKQGSAAANPVAASRLVFVPMAIYAQKAGALEGSFGGDVSGVFTNLQIGGGAVGTAEMAPDAVNSAKILNGAVANADLAPDAVTTDKILNGTILNEDIANGEIDDSKISDVSYSKLLKGGAANGQVLKFSTAQNKWTPQNDNDTPVSAGAGISINNSVVSALDPSPTNEFQMLSWSTTDGTMSISPNGNAQTITAKGQVYGNLNDMKLQPVIDMPVGLKILGGALEVNGSKQMNYSFYNFLAWNDSKIVCTGATTGSITRVTFQEGFTDTAAVGNALGTAVNEGGNFSIVAAARIKADEFNAVSDIRIKNIIGRSPAARDLEILKSLSVKNYTHKDIVAHGPASKKGFIAQEVEKVFPEAVSRTTDFIPDIYQIARDVRFDAATRSLRLTVDSLAGGLAAGDKIRIIADQQREAIVQKIDGTTITLADWPVPTTTEAFVFGKQVDDFRVVDYDRIFTLNVSATQALIAESEAQKAQIEQLLSEKAATESRFDRLEADLKKLAAKLGEPAAARSAGEK